MCLKTSVIQKRYNPNIDLLEDAIKSFKNMSDIINKTCLDMGCILKRAFQSSPHGPLSVNKILAG